jgi:hypothetical protein
VSWNAGNIMCKAVKYWQVSESHCNCYCINLLIR